MTTPSQPGHHDRDKNSAPLAVIDLGSNTALLLIFSPHAPLEILHEEFEIPRLAQCLQVGQPLHPPAVERVVKILQTYRRICDEKSARLLFVGGTAPFRKAADGKALVKQIEQSIDCPVIVLTGEQEAALSYFAALHNHSKAEMQSQAVIDIGGGSSELIFGSKTSIDHSVSLPFGCVDLTEGFLPEQQDRQGMSSPEALQKLRAFLSGEMKILESRSATRLLAVAGTPVTIGLLSKEIQGHQPQQVDGVKVSLVELQNWIKTMASTVCQEKIVKYGIAKGRAEILLAGMLVLESAMLRLQQKEFTVCYFGLRHGLALHALGLVPAAIDLSRPSGSPKQ